jgi:drug/metabolite transporter (DMT)-like permease
MIETTAPPPKAGMSANARGALWMMGSAVGFVVMAVLVKFLGPDQSTATLIFWRSMAGLVAMLPFALLAGPSVWKVTRPGKLILRSTYGTVGFFAGFYALAHLPLAESQALSFSRTLFITVLAVFLLKEKVAWRRWAAVGVGFLGIILMTKPGMGSFSLASGLAVFSALAFAFSIVTVKDLTRDHSPMTLVLYANLLTTIAGFPFLFLDPRVPSLHDMGLLTLMGVAGVAAQSCYVRALSTGEASLMGLLDYVRLPMVALAGFIFFAEVPDTLAMVGAAVVVLSTLYITMREMQLKKERPADPVRPV